MFVLIIATRKIKSAMVKIHSFNSFFIECHPSCSACVNGSSLGCLNCSGTGLLYQGQCFSQCPSWTYPLGTTCEDCSIHCLTCRNSILCTSCDSETFLIIEQEQCVTADQCPIGTYGDELYHQCRNCDASCQTCLGPTSSDCLTCKISLGYAQKTTPGAGQCQKVVCSQGQYLNISTTKATCLSCNPECDSCNSNYPTRCTKCKKQYIETNDQQGLVICQTCSDFLGLKQGAGSTCDG